RWERRATKFVKTAGSNRPSSASATPSTPRGASTRFQSPQAAMDPGMSFMELLASVAGSAPTACGRSGLYMTQIWNREIRRLKMKSISEPAFFY
ncbi:hypothetical protein BRADI_4g13583v3, partial [Brachypodium distachyon]